MEREKNLCLVWQFKTSYQQNFFFGECQQYVMASGNSSLASSSKSSLLERWWDAGTGCPERLWMPRPWRCSRPGWMGPWATWSRKWGGWWPCLAGGLEIHDPWGPFQPRPFCDSVILPWFSFSMKNYNENSESISGIYLHGLDCSYFLSCPACRHSDAWQHFPTVKTVPGPERCSCTQWNLWLAMLSAWRNMSDEVVL